MSVAISSDLTKTDYDKKLYEKVEGSGNQIGDFKKIEVVIPKAKSKE